MFTILMPGWILVTGTYFVTLMAASMAYAAITGQPIDHNRDLSGFVIGLLVAILPYITGGMLAGKAGSRAAALWIGLLPAVCEKILIFLIAAMFVAAGGDGGGDGIVTYASVMGFASAEAVPYFTTTYLFTTPLSVLVCVFTAQLCQRTPS